MKRLVWLFLAVFCIALMQVRPADGLTIKAKSCGCCQVPGACGTAGCAAPAPSPAACNVTQSTAVASRPAGRAVRIDLSAVVKFYVSFVRPADFRRPPVAPPEMAPAVDVPLFKAHCSFLI